MNNFWEYLAAVQDAMRGFGRGVANSGTDLVGRPGDLRSGVQNAVNPALDRVFGAPATDAPQPKYNILPTAEEARNALPAYEPQTNLGRGARTAGEILPLVLGAPAAMGAVNRASGLTDDIAQFALTQ